MSVASILNAQISISLNENAIPHPSAMLDLDFENNQNSGVLLPKVSINDATDNSSISNPADYLMVFSPAQNDFSALNFWNQDKWENLSTETKTQQGIATHISGHIAQSVLWAAQSEPEDSFHQHGISTYTLPINNILLDHHDTYNINEYHYTIATDGMYEIICNSVITASDTKGSDIINSQVFIWKEGNKEPLTSGLVNKLSYISEINNTVSYIGSLLKGEKIYCTVSAGNDNDNSHFAVLSSFITVSKY